MATSSLSLCLLIFSCLLSVLPISSAKPHALVLPVKKDRYTNQYVTRVNARTPLVPLSLVVDLGGRYLWVDCDSSYVSSTYRPVHCGTPECSLNRPQFGCNYCRPPYHPGCNHHACVANPESPTVGTDAELGQDAFAFRSIDGSNPGPVVRTSDFIFSCAPRSLLKGLASGASGVAGLGRNRIAMPVQLAVEFRLQPKFAICLSPSAASDGVIFFGGGPYNFMPNYDISRSFIYTPLIINNVSTARSYVKGERSVEHFIQVKRIKVNWVVVPVKASLLEIDREGRGGTKISTVAPYTVLESSIYKAVTDAFAAGMSKAKVKRVDPVAPFKLCYNAADIVTSGTGPSVPPIDLVLHNQYVVWRIYGANSMVEAKKGVLCLGFVDGGAKPRTSIVIGGHQIEDHLLQFDLEKRMLGFTSSLLLKRTSCAKFNFTRKL